MSFIPTDECFDALKRCTKCLLPDSFPGIKFDQEGVCNYCRDQPPVVVFGEEAFKKKLDQYRGKGSNYDCIVPISGGRDSAYTLYKMVRDYKMRVLSLTVDSGFISDEAFRNIDTITKKLNVEHVFLKDDEQIKTARKNSVIKFKGWIKNPNINTIVPILNSGDKLMNLRMYQYAHENGIPILMGGNIFGNSTFEQDHFKTGFLNIFGDDHARYTLSDKVKLISYYGFDFLRNSYNWHYSIFKEYFGGTIIYFFESLFKPSDVEPIGFYDYIKWNEKQIIETDIAELKWKGAEDTVTTWRIDDTAYPMINYLYFYLAGFTEHTELFSKMIRDGQISRDVAYERCKGESRPRIKSLIRTLKEFDITEYDFHLSLKNYRKKIIKKYLHGTSFEKCTF